MRTFFYFQSYSVQQHEQTLLLSDSDSGNFSDIVANEADLDQRCVESSQTNAKHLADEDFIETMSQNATLNDNESMTYTSEEGLRGDGYLDQQRSLYVNEFGTFEPYLVLFLYAKYEDVGPLPMEDFKVTMDKFSNDPCGDFRDHLMRIQLRYIREGTFSSQFAMAVQEYVGEGHVELLRAVLKYLIQERKKREPMSSMK